jgi:hypothetical protein
MWAIVKKELEVSDFLTDSVFGGFLGEGIACQEAPYTRHQLSVRKLTIQHARFKIQEEKLLSCLRTYNVLRSLVSELLT